MESARTTRGIHPGRDPASRSSSRPRGCRRFCGPIAARSAQSGRPFTMGAVPGSLQCPATLAFLQSALHAGDRGAAVSIRFAPDLRQPQAAIVRRGKHKRLAHREPSSRKLAYARLRHSRRSGFEVAFDPNYSCRPGCHRLYGIYPPACRSPPLNADDEAPHRT